MDTLELRSRFEGLDGCTHLVSHSLGAMPTTARSAMTRYADQWVGRSVTAWYDWFPRVRGIADQLGRIFGAPPGSVVLHQNVSTLANALLSALTPTPARNRIVASTHDFSTMRYLLQAHDGHGFELVDVDSTDAEEIAAAIDERTLLVAVSHVFYGTSTLLDPAPVVAAGKRHGALSLIDSYQGVGVVPVDVAAWDCDFLVGGSIKWLCGGPGVCYLYAKPQVAETLHPRQVGWLSHADPFAFEPTLREADGVWRFLGGTPNPLACEVASCGYAILETLDIAEVRAHSLALTQRLREGAEALGGITIKTPAEDARRAGTIVMDFDGAAEACKTLQERTFWVDHRPGYGLRVSPHFYTSADEIDRFL
ncbi:MAG: aminotransferase class V-fold PLP-dependent enzyme, partial [Planctomycetota bacterium]